MSCNQGGTRFNELRSVSHTVFHLLDGYSTYWCCLSSGQQGDNESLGEVDDLHCGKPQVFSIEMKESMK